VSKPIGTTDATAVSRPSVEIREAAIRVATPSPFVVLDIAASPILLVGSPKIFTSAARVTSRRVCNRRDWGLIAPPLKSVLLNLHQSLSDRHDEACDADPERVHASLRLDRQACEHDGSPVWP
jgi:hypothetical protein